MPPEPASARPEHLHDSENRKVDAPVLRAIDVHKSYGSTPALRGVNVDLRRGEWLGLLGPNGAGKTTLVKAIAGRVRLDAGEIELFETRVSSGGRAAQHARTKLGIVPQDIALYPFLTAKENLEVFGSLSGLAGSTLKDRVEWALEFTGLKDRADGRLHTYSGGMKRRLNIACSVLHKPKVILLDEPTVGVDPQSRERIWDMLALLRDEGASLLLTSHQLDEVERVCDRIVIIDEGQVVADGTVHDLITQTIGHGRRVTLIFDEPPGSDSLDKRIKVEGNRAVCTIDRVVQDLPALLEECAAAGATVHDVHVETPTLHRVFIHLTGRELRE